MNKILRATIDACCETNSSLSVGAYVDCPEQNVNEWRDRIENALTNFVVQLTMSTNLLYSTKGVVWREKGNRNVLRDFQS